MSVAQLRANKELRILDLVTEPEWPNPFLSETVGYEVEFAGLLIAFGEQLGEPLRYRDNPIDYIPSQKLAELIERAGVDGIRYPSAMALGGRNVVLFDPASVDIEQLRLVEIVEATIAYEEIKWSSRRSVVTA